MAETYRNLTSIGYSWEDHNIEEDFQSSRRHERHETTHTREKTLCTLNVLKPLHVTVIFTVMKKHILH
ncbi:hypothetical protein U0070_004730 [Myodes glareolus]|uniref:Uncharacterized protein n=1 Tax=Myodes glareolus TaxID=447135 RepID=A0AAW0GZZ2_MYOGA